MGLLKEKDSGLLMSDDMVEVCKVRGGETLDVEGDDFDGEC